MMTNGINLKAELDKLEHAEDRISERLFQQITDVFAKDMFAENNVIRNLKNKIKNNEIVELKSFDPTQVYKIDSIKKLSIKYRLRFLHSSLYKYEFPAEAIFKIRELERRNETQFQDFYLLAPKEVFELGDINADDLNWLRAIKNYPLRGISEFLISVLAFAFIFQLLIPSSVMNIEPGKEMVFRLWLTTHCFIAFFAFFIFLGALSNKGFSNSDWKSKYFNS
jgi:hypothetical protein